jgi:hypothetical protein
MRTGRRVGRRASTVCLVSFWSTEKVHLNMQLPFHSTGEKSSEDLRLELVKSFPPSLPLPPSLSGVRMCEGVREVGSTSTRLP